MNQLELDILLPTYNRAKDLIKNLEILDRQVRTIENRKIKVIVSNNASTDQTFSALEYFRKETRSFELEIYHQTKNIGLEPNAVFLLEKATANFIMYLGDDDFLPNGYIEFVLNTIDKDKKLGCIIPGFSALYKDGTVKKSRSAKYDIKRYKRGFISLLKISHYGHQLSGLVSKREGLLDSYLAINNCRNIYPFIFFVSKPIKENGSYYVPKFQVLVSQENTKDWTYDESGLLTEAFKNYKLLYPHNFLRRFLLELSFSTNQSWRLRAGGNIKNAWSAYLHLTFSKDIDTLYKITLPVIYLLCYLKKLSSLVRSIS